MIKAEEATLEFRRLYIEKTQYQHTEEAKIFRCRVDVVTALWFCDGTIILYCKADQTELDFEGESQKTESLEPLETVVHHGFVQSHAIRLAIAAHDRLLAVVQAKLPKDAERSR